jgi:hypothetical protein
LGARVSAVRKRRGVVSDNGGRDEKREEIGEGRRVVLGYWVIMVEVFYLLLDGAL